MENVQVQVTQVLKQTKPEVPLGSPAKEAQPEEAMENVQAQVTQVPKQTKPEVPLGSPAKEVQPEAQLEPTAKETIPAAAVDKAALIATLQTMQHDMQLSPGVSGFPSSPQVTEEEREKGNAGDPAIPSEVMTRSRRREQRPRNWRTRLRRKQTPKRQPRKQVRRWKKCRRRQRRCKSR
jgi:hypothetical protein